MILLWGVSSQDWDKNVYENRDTQLGELSVKCLNEILPKSRKFYFIMVSELYNCRLFLTSSHHAKKNY